MLGRLTSARWCSGGVRVVARRGEITMHWSRRSTSPMPALASVSRSARPRIVASKALVPPGAALMAVRKRFSSLGLEQCALASENALRLARSDARATSADALRPTAGGELCCCCCCCCCCCSSAAPGARSSAKASERLPVELGGGLEEVRKCEDEAQRGVKRRVGNTTITCSLH